MSSNVLPLSEYCNAMRVTCIFATCYLECSANWEWASWQTLVFFHERCPRRVDCCRLTDRGYSWALHIKGLCTMIISAWGTGYKARYLRIRARLDHQDYFGQIFVILFMCVWVTDRFLMPLLKQKLAQSLLPPLCSLLIWVRTSSRIHALVPVGVYRVFLSVLGPISTNQRQEPWS